MKHCIRVRILIALLLLASSSFLAAAEKTAPPKPDPILANLKVSGDAVWSPQTDKQGKPTPPSLAIAVKLEGTAAARASSFGDVKLDVLVDDHGKSYRETCSSHPGKGMDTICRNGLPDDEGDLSLVFTIPGRPPIRSIRELRGSVAVQTGGESEKVIIPDVFTDLEDPAKDKNADLDNWGNMVRDKNLKSLGITMFVSRRQIYNWESYDGAPLKDKIGVRIESKQHAVVACEIVDAQGKPMRSGFSWFGRSPKWDYELTRTVRVPSDARLRLTLQKNGRTIRVPFALKDIIVPKIDPSQKQLNAPPAPVDPLLADLKVTAKAEWQPEFDFNNNGGTKPNMTPKSPTLRIVVEMLGTAANHTSAFGELKLESVVAQDGRSYRRACEVFRGGEMQDNFHKSSGPWRGSEGLRFDISIRNRPPIESFRAIRGHLALQTGGEFKTVVIKNAFKNLGKAPDARPTNSATPIAISGENQWIAPPLKDKSLDGLGIQVAAKRLGVQYSGNQAKDNVNIEIHCGDRVFDCDILDAKGKPMEYVCWSSSSTGSQWLLEFATREAIAPDAELRVVLHKNSRKVRVPFEITNVAVPKINASDKFLNVPASADSMVREAESVPFDDPILDGLETDAKASWMPWSGNVKPPDLVLRVDLKGKAIAHASACGEAEIESAMDAEGNALDFPTEEPRMKLRFSDPAKPRDFGVQFVLRAAKFTPKIHNLRGSLAVQLGGKYETVVVKDFLKKMKKPNGAIDDAVLKSLGISVEVERKENIGREYNGIESLNLRFKSNRVPLVWCEVTDAEGDRLQEGSSSWGGDQVGANWWRSFKEAIPADAQLRITIHKDSRKILVPFDFKDIEVPPLPKGDGGTRGSGFLLPFSQ